MVKLFK